VGDFDFSRVTAWGGAEGVIHRGAAGTVYLKGAGTPGELRITDPNQTAETWTPLGLPSDLVFTAERLVVSGTNVLVMPEHGMPLWVGDLELLGGAILSHLPNTLTQTYSLDVEAAGRLVIDANSRIDVNGRGYLAGRTLGNTNAGASTGYSGGSHGGRGFSHNGSSGAVYDNAAAPHEPGSGGAGGNGYAGGSGGGVVRLQAGQIVLDGSVVANGTGGAGGGGGSGGAVYIKAGGFAGSGRVSANGAYAPNNAGGGGGGRIAIHTPDFLQFSIGNLVAAGGSGSSGPGEAGTVFLTNVLYAIVPLITQQPRSQTVSVGTHLFCGRHGGRTHELSVVQGRATVGRSNRHLSRAYQRATDGWGRLLGRCLKSCGDHHQLGGYPDGGGGPSRHPRLCRMGVT
jgi:hypothetical protein